MSDSIIDLIILISTNICKLNTADSDKYLVFKKILESNIYLDCVPAVLHPYLIFDLSCNCNFIIVFDVKK